MSGICGWSTAGSSTPISADIDTMALGLKSPLPGEILSWSREGNALAATTETGGSGSLFHDDTLAVAYHGAAHFVDPFFNSIADRHNIAAALAECYRRKGTACLDDLHGPFAVALLNLKTKSTLLAIDRMGIESLSLSLERSGIIFGSNTDCIMSHPAAPRQVDSQSVYDYLYFHMVPSPRAIYRDVEKLLPGQLASFENGRLHKRFYWHLDYCDKGGAPQEQLADEFRDLLRQTVRRSLTGRYAKTGNFLSGGTDSSTLAGIATEITGRPADTYSIGFEAEGYDETKFAEIAARHFGTRHHRYYVTPQDVVDIIPLIARAYDEPFGNASAVPTYCCARLARNDGVELMIAGDGGDELFGGNARYIKQRSFEAYHRLPAFLRRSVIEPLAFHLPGAGPVRKLQSYISQARVPLPDRLETYNFLHRSPAAEIFDGEFLGELDLDEPLEIMREAYWRTSSSSSLHRMLHLDLKNTLADNDLRKVNKMCEQAGVAVRYPLLDDAMAEFSARVPPELKIRGLTLRYFFKDSLKGFLPPEIINKSKHGFGLPFGPWMNTHAPLRDLVGDSLQALQKRNILKPSYIDNLLMEVSRQHSGYYGVMIWVLVMLEQWFQRSPRPPSV